MCAMALTCGIRLCAAGTIAIVAFLSRYQCLCAWAVSSICKAARDAISAFEGRNLVKPGNDFIFRAHHTELKWIGPLRDQKQLCCLQQGIPSSCR